MFNLKKTKKLSLSEIKINDLFLLNRWWTKSKSYKEVFIKTTFVVSCLSLILVHLIEINNFHFLFETEWIFFCLVIFCFVWDVLL